MFKKQFFSIVVWKAFVYLLGVFSLLIVTPALTSQPKIFGIYSFCISLLIFFAYADLGFITACRKFAAEYVAKKKLKAEIAITGFSCLVFLLVCVPLSGGILYFSFHPNIIISDLKTPYEYHISFYLLLILAISFPILILQRMVQIIYSVRLKDAIVYRLEIVAIIIRILSALYFFRSGKYQIIEFFALSNIINLINLIVLCIIAHIKFKYNFLFFVKCLRFRKTIYNKISKLAFASLFISLAWLLYYEIDIVLITSISGAVAAAYYAVAFNVVNILRNLLGTLYYPLVVKLNYLVVEDKEKIKMFIYQLIKLGNYIILPAICLLIIFAKPLIVSWLGVDYQSAAFILQLLFASYLLYPANTLFGTAQTAFLNIRLLYFTAGIQLVCQYVGLLIFSHYGNVSIPLAGFKILGAFITSVILFQWATQYLKISILDILKKVYIVPVLFCVATYLILTPFLNKIVLDKSIIKLFEFTGAIIVVYIIIFISLLFIDKGFKKQVFEIIKR